MRGGRGGPGLAWAPAPKNPLIKSFPLRSSVETHPATLQRRVPYTGQGVTPERRSVPGRIPALERGNDQLKAFRRGFKPDPTGSFTFKPFDPPSASGADHLSSLIREGPEPPLDKETPVNLFRIAQEGASNIIRHSGATRMVLTLTRSDDALTLTLTDRTTARGKGMKHKYLPKSFSRTQKALECGLTD